MVNTSYLIPHTSRSKAFTLVEVLVGAAVFLIVALSAYNAYVALFQLINLSQYKILAVNLANEQFEIARNMPYVDVGIVGGIPKGKLSHIQSLVRGGVTFTVTTTVRNLDLPFDGTIGGSPNDLSPADNKLVDITVSCGGCKNMKPISLTGQVAPKNLETESSNGALFIRVFDANGQPVQGASVHIVNVATTTSIVIDDVTDATGMLQIVDVPPGDNAYRIVVAKSGYSTDRTYLVGAVDNPTPSKPDATVLLQQVTQVSFAIDRLSTLTVLSVTPTCAVVPNFDFALVGSKQLGTNVPKFSQNMVTDSSGSLVLSNIMEWDTYTIIPTDTVYDISGLNPLNPVTINANSLQQVQIISIPRDPRSLLITVKDSATQLPISDSVVTVSGTGYNNIQTTGKGFINQTDWSGGSGQVSYTNNTKYFNDDTNIDVTSASGLIKLRSAFNVYNFSGEIQSSTFDTGSPSNFYTLDWSPTDQPLLAGTNSVRLQIATASTTSPTAWNFLGPDGTSATYYTVPNTPINIIHNGDRYLRYKIFLTTEDASVSPNITDVAFTFTSSCTPPGQVVFSALSSGTYHIHVTKTGYTDFDYDSSVGSNWQEVPVVMTQ
jgi:prepilin-type N-terminal cleavage/methylation domain-containing protein